MKARKEVEVYVATALRGFTALNLKTAPEAWLLALREAMLGLLEEINEELARQAEREERELKELEREERIEARRDHWLHDAYDRENDR